MSARRESLMIDPKFKSHHVSLAVDALIRNPVKWGKVLVRKDGGALSEQDIDQIIRECQAQGYDVVPICDHIKPNGSCAGHPVVTCEEWGQA